jgi:DNA invertase Pin-like site-specific DNA recombinase/predicted RNA-binding Zn-ribbon protein involved in translation (DUF1610 family)
MKAILLVRVSTTVQELKEQEREVYELAIKDGYKDEDIIPICEKESGIKLKEEERLGLNRLKEVVEAEDVRDVYIWEVSRLARTKKVLFSMEEYFVSRKIQVTFKAPNFFRLLKADGTLDEGADMIFTIYAQMAESEMRTKKERFKRSKDARRKQGFFTGGFILYGYTIDDEKRLVPKEGEADVVRMLYTYYLTGKYSFRSLAKEVRDNGIFVDKSFTAAQTAINHILTNTAYAGVPSGDGSKITLKTDGNVYPPLVTLEMVERCREIAQKNIIEPKKKYSTYYFGKSILRCPDCGKVMMAVKARNFYHCTKCGNKNIININMVDSALWAVAAPLYTVKMQNKAEGQKEYYESEIATLQGKIAVANNEIAKLQDRAEKVEYKAYVEGTMAINKADAFIAELNAKITTQRKQIATFENQIRDFESLLVEFCGEYDGTFIEDVASIKDEQIRYDIVHQTIKMATIERVDGFKMRAIITIWDMNGNTYRYLLNSQSHKIYSKFTNDGVGIEEVEGAYEERFQSNYQNDGKDREARLQYLKEYRESKKNTEEAKAANAERQRRFRARKKAEANND